MNKRRLVCLLLLTLLISLAACDTPKPQTSPLQSPVKQSPAVSLSTATGLVPNGYVQVGDTFSFDYDKDGTNEVAVVYTAEGDKTGGGILVAKPNNSSYSVLWKSDIPADLKVTEFKTRDMLNDDFFELLVFTQRLGTTKFPLYVYRWSNGTFVQLKPNGGKLAGQDTFTSDYWPTTLGDVDDDSVMEIVPTLELDPPREFLEPVVYQWDGSNFTFTDFYIIPPRFKPEGK